jgi:hypothetical protein
LLGELRGDERSSGAGLGLGLSRSLPSPVMSSMPKSSLPLSASLPLEPSAGPGHLVSCRVRRRAAAMEALRARVFGRLGFFGLVRRTRGCDGLRARERVRLRVRGRVWCDGSHTHLSLEEAFDALTTTDAWRLCCPCSRPCLPSRFRVPSTKRLANFQVRVKLSLYSFAHKFLLTVNCLINAPSK